MFIAWMMEGAGPSLFLIETFIALLFLWSQHSQLFLCLTSKSLPGSESYTVVIIRRGERSVFLLLDGRSISENTTQFVQTDPCSHLLP